MKTELFPGKFDLSLEYTISKALSNYVELDFKDKGQSGFTGDMTNSMAKFIICIVEDSGELTKAWLKYAVKQSVSK